MKSCHLEPSLECYHLEGVCVARGNEWIGCSELRHNIKDNIQKIKPITPIEMARDYERTLSRETKELTIQSVSRSTDILSPNKTGEFCLTTNSIATVQTGSDTYSQQKQNSKHDGSVVYIANRSESPSTQIDGNKTADSYHRPDDDFGHTDGSTGREK